MFQGKSKQNLIRFWLCKFLNSFRKKKEKKKKKKKKRKKKKRRILKTIFISAIYIIYIKKNDFIVSYSFNCVVHLRMLIIKRPQSPKTNPICGSIFFDWWWISARKSNNLQRLIKKLLRISYFSPLTKEAGV